MLWIHKHTQTHICFKMKEDIVLWKWSIPVFSFDTLYLMWSAGKHSFKNTHYITLLLLKKWFCKKHMGQYHTFSSATLNYSSVINAHIFKAKLKKERVLSAISISFFYKMTFLLEIFSMFFSCLNWINVNCLPK